MYNEFYNLSRKLYRYYNYEFNFSEIYNEKREKVFAQQILAPLAQLSLSAKSIMRQRFSICILIS